MKYQLTVDKRNTNCQINATKCKITGNSLNVCVYFPVNQPISPMKRITILQLIFITFFLCIASNLVWAQNGIDTSETINSFGPIGEFYKMDYSGDYDELLDMMDDLLTRSDNPFPDDFKCSLFSANGDLNMQILGRNFDNDDNDVLLTRYNSPNAYSSIAFTRMTDLGYAVGTNYNSLSFEEKIPILQSAYFVPDGINEHGLACGLASVNPVSYTVDPGKDTIFITRLIREILDHADSCAEALSIANSYNVFDNGVGVISHHVLLGSVTGESLTLEFSGGEFRAVETDSTWQVLTNIPVYNIPHSQLMNTCWRYRSLYTDLQDCAGILTWEEGMQALDRVHLNCPWSAIYDLNSNGVYIAIDNNFTDITHTDIEAFEFILIVGTEEAPVAREFPLELYPNPCNDILNVICQEGVSGPCIGEMKKGLLKIYNLSGQKVLELDTGLNSVTKINMSTLPEGGYVIQLQYEGVAVASRFLVVD